MVSVVDKVSVNIGQQSPVEATNQLVKHYNVYSQRSLPEKLSMTRIEPYTLIDRRLNSVDPDLVRSLLQMVLAKYSHYYLQSVQIELAASQGSHILDILERHATNPSMRDALRDNTWIRMTGNMMKLGNESAEYINIDLVDDGSPNLPTDWSEYQHKEEPMDDVGLENSTIAGGDSRTNLGPRVSSTVDGDVFKRINDDSNLAVGKLLDLRVSIDGNTITIPISVTLTPKLINPDDIVNSVQYTSVDKSLNARWHAARAGEIRWIKDFIFARDLIEMDRKAVMGNTGGLFEVKDKTNKAILAGLASGRGSPNAISSVMIITEETAKEIGRAMNGNLDRRGDRERFFKGNVLMMLIVVDTLKERFVLYERGRSDGATYTLNEIKSVKTQGNDLEATLKAYRLGSGQSLYN